MPWIKLDDSFFCHPKIVNVGAEASGLYVWALTYSGHNLTDGKIPGAWVKQVVGARAKKLAGCLVTHRLWSEDGADWQIHDYLDYNPSRERVLAKRAEDSKRKANGR